MMRRLLAGLLAFTAATSALAISPYVAEYEVLRDGKLLGVGTVTLSRDAHGEWELVSLTRGTRGLAGIAGIELREYSRLRRDVDGWETRRYAWRQSAAWRTRERSVEIEGRQVISRDRDREYVFEHRPGVLDRQAVILALADAVARGARDTVSFTVVDRDEFGPQHYRIDAEERIEVPAGSVLALRVERLREPPSKRTTTTWLEPERDYIPVRVLQTEPDGETMEMRLVSFRRTP